jgi:hypothetical protein
MLALTTIATTSAQMRFSFQDCLSASLVMSCESTDFAHSINERSPDYGSNSKTAGEGATQTDGFALSPRSDAVVRSGKPRQRPLPGGSNWPTKSLAEPAPAQSHRQDSTRILTDKQSHCRTAKAIPPQTQFRQPAQTRGGRSRPI